MTTTFNFDVMLDNIYDNMNKKKDEKIILPKLNIEITTTNTFFKNIKDILKTLRFVILFHEKMS